MTGDVIEPFKITPIAVKQAFVQKNRIETSTCHRFQYSKN